MSKPDALAWREMVAITLDHPETVSFDLAIYAQGLATTVRSHGAAYARAKWLDVEVPQEQWIRGLRLKLDHEAMIQDPRLRVGPAVRP